MTEDAYVPGLRDITGMVLVVLIVVIKVIVQNAV